VPTWVARSSFGEVQVQQGSEARCVTSLMSGSGEAAMMTTQLGLQKARRLAPTSSEEGMSESEK
jgi:hypothetical protein